MQYVEVNFHFDGDFATSPQRFRKQEQNAFIATVIISLFAWSLGIRVDPRYLKPGTSSIGDELLILTKCT